MSHLPYVAAAALIGFTGNEIVARYRFAVGRRIGSAALVADGLHAAPMDLGVALLRDVDCRRSTIWSTRILANTSRRSVIYIHYNIFNGPGSVSNLDMILADL